MMDEHLQDLAAEYALNALDPESMRTFEAMLSENAELKLFADQLRETAATLANDAPRTLPPPEIRERVLSRIRAESQAVMPPTQTSTPSTAAPVPTKGGAGNLLPWALAAGFAITTAALWTERNALQNETAALKHDLVEVRNQSALDHVRIATLSAQVDAYAKANATVVWDKEQKRGVVKLSNVPPPASGKDYQLWVIDPKYPKPVSAGVITVAANEETGAAFTPDQPIRKADKFAISVEPTGGVPEPTGSIIFLGQ